MTHATSAAPLADGDAPDASVPWRLILAVWLLPAVADVADVYVTRRLAGSPIALWRAAAWVFPEWYVWVPLSAVALRLATRFPLRRPLRARALLAHVAGALGAAFAHALVITTARWVFDPLQHRPWDAELVMSIEDWLPISLILWGMSLGAAQALLRVRAARAQEQRAAALEARLAQAELAVLRSQLEPHFLFNALNTAVSLVRAGDGAAGVDVLTRLGDLLRHLLHGVGQETTLAEELRVLEAYLGIERARFGARLTVDVEIPDALHDAIVPSLALQPLVENALRHGVGRRDAPGHVRIAARADGGTLVLSVRDDGPGPGAGAPWPRRAGSGGGVGLRNVRDRLARLYGREATVTLTSPVDGESGTEAVVRLPLRRAAGAPAAPAATERAASLAGEGT